MREFGCFSPYYRVLFAYYFSLIVKWVAKYDEPSQAAVRAGVAVTRLSGPGASFAGVAAELGVTSTQLKTWKLGLDAAGSAAAIVIEIAVQPAEAAEPAQPQCGDKRLTEEVEVLRTASAFLRSLAI